MRILQSLASLISGTNRVATSRYPSHATPQLASAWKAPQVRWTAVRQPYADPLTIYNGNAIMNGETEEMRREYREWAFREPSTKAALLTKCLSVASLDPQLTPANKSKALDKAAAKWVDYSISRAAGGWGELVRYILMPGAIDGYSVNEPVWDEIDQHNEDYPGFWTVKRFAMIDTHHMRFSLDEYRQVIGVRPMTGLSGWVDLPPENFLIYRHLGMFENPFGISDLRAVVRDCRLLEDAIQLRHTLMANWSGPFLRAMSGDDAVRRQLPALLERARAGGYIVLPKDSTLDVINLATSSPEVFNSAIVWYREQIIAAIQGSYLQLISSDGERGDTRVAKSVSELFTWWLASAAAEVINTQLIPALVRPNYGNAVGLPRVSFGGIDENNVKAALERLKMVQDMGEDLSKEQVRTLGGAESPLDESDRLKPLQSPQQGQGGDNPFGSPGGGGGGPFPQAGNSPRTQQTFRDSSPNRSVLHCNTDDCNPTSMSVKWKPYTSPDGKQGYISPQGQVRYDNPTKQDQQKTTDNKASHDADVAELAGPDATPEVKAEISSRYQKAKEAVYSFMYNKFNPALAGVGELLKAVGDEPDDMKKFGYNPASHGGGGGGINDPMKNATGISTHIALSIGSKVASKVFMWLKNKGKAAPATMDEGDVFDQAAPTLAELYDLINRSIGLDAEPSDPKLIAAALRAATGSVEEMSDADFVTVSAMTFAVEWKPYTNPKTKQSGWVSPKGQVRYEKPKGGDTTPKPTAAEKQYESKKHRDAVFDAVNGKTTVTDENVKSIAESVNKLTVGEIKNHAANLKIKLGGKKAELAARLVEAIRKAGGITKPPPVATPPSVPILQPQPPAVTTPVPQVTPDVTPTPVTYPGFKSKLPPGENAPNKLIAAEARPQLTAAEVKAVVRYTGGAYESFNKLLRAGRPLESAADEETMKGLDAAFKKAKRIRPPVVATRGMDIAKDKLPAFLDAMRANMGAKDFVAMPGYHSTTVSKSQPAFSGNVQMRIEATHGLDVKPVSEYPHEDELLLAHNSRFRVVGVEDQGGGKWLVRMQQLAPIGMTEIGKEKN